MDVNNWKLVLMQWINCTKLSDKTLFSLDEADVEEIFGLFKSHVTTVDLRDINLINFLNVNYPEFDLHLDDSSQISTTDSMYIFSLLLHYSCVKQPQEYYHNLCNGLTAKYQNYVARFLSNLVDKTVINRELLRSTISVSLPHSPQIWTAESPIRTPKAKYSPPTPKTNLLEEKTRDLQLLKAQLETERYEKGFLEVVVKKNEQQIQKMSTEHKKLLNELKKLRNELLESNTENCTPNKNINDEKIKKKLRKEIADKEEMIIKIKMDIDSLNEDKKICNQKLLYAEKQVSLYLNKCKEYDIIVDNLKLLLQNKDETIKSLHEANTELEMIINDIRIENHSHDQSAECLDFSFSQTTNSSGQSSEPENLGLSVIDIQLKEHEKENVKLKKDITFLTKENIDLKIQLEKDFKAFKESTNNHYGILNETINELNTDKFKLNIEIEKNNDDLVILKNEKLDGLTKITQIETSLDESKVSNSKQTAELVLLAHTNIENVNKINDITKQIIEVQESNERLSEENKLLAINFKKLIDSNNNFLTENKKLAQNIEILNENIRTLSNIKNNLNEVNSQLSESNKALTKDNKELVKQKDILSKQNLSFATQNEELDNCNKKKSHDKMILIKDNEKLMKEKESLVKEKESLNEEKIKLIADYEALIKANSTLADDENQKLTQINEKLLKTNEESKLNNENLRQENEQLCLRNTELTRNNEEMRKDNNLLKEEIIAINKIMETNEKLQTESILSHQKIEMEFSDLLNENKLAQKRETDLKTEFAELSEAKTILESTNAELIQNKIELEVLVETLKAQHNSINKASEQRLEELNKAKQINSELEEKLIALDMEYKLNKNSLNTQKLASLELSKEKEINEKLTQDVQKLRAKLFKHRELSEEKEKSWQTEKKKLVKKLNTGANEPNKSNIKTYIIQIIKYIAVMFFSILLFILLIKYQMIENNLELYIHDNRVKIF